MRGFIIGIIFTVVVGALCIYGAGKLGLIDMRADQTPSKFETHFAMSSMDASVDRRAPDLKNPVQPTDDNLRAGMHIYEMNCAVCHGDGQTPQAQLYLYPPAPQFAKEAADMPDNQNFYIIQHGVRLTGMPGWSKSLKEDDIWKLVTFITHTDKLPPDIQKDWSPNGPAPAQKGAMEHE
jgi:mono/diheme cytochrome c family protein